MSLLYRVVIPAQESVKLKDWAMWSQLQKKRDLFLKALKILNYRLSTEPTDSWSEPYRDLDTLGLQLRFGAEEMLGVDYGVHQTSRTVFVKRFHWIGPNKPPDKL